MSLGRRGDNFRLARRPPPPLLKSGLVKRLLRFKLFLVFSKSVALLGSWELRRRAQGKRLQDRLFLRSFVRSFRFERPSVPSVGRLDWLTDYTSISTMSRRKAKRKRRAIRRKRTAFVAIQKGQPDHQKPPTIGRTYSFIWSIEGWNKLDERWTIIQRRHARLHSQRPISDWPRKKGITHKKDQEEDRREGMGEVQ